MTLSVFKSLPRRVLNWLHRFRKRCGYGIHSPYAFAFVTGVVYEKGNYYAYEQLARELSASCWREKDIRLLFRVANFSEARSALLVGACLPEVVAAFRAARPQSKVVETDDADLVAFKDEKFDFCYVSSTQLSEQIACQLPSLATPCAVMVLQGIHLSRKTKAAWQVLQSNRRVRVTFDLYDFGIACFEPRLNKENFTINYF